MAMHSRARWFALPLVVFALAGCGKKSLSSPWKELGFPLEGSSIESDTRNDATTLNLECNGMTTGPFFQKHADAFTKAGYADKEVRRDPLSGMITHEFTKGTQVISFTMSGTGGKCYIAASVK